MEPNPLVEGWLQVWDKLTGRRWRYRPDPYHTTLDWEAARFVNYIYQHSSFEYRQAYELVQRGRLKPNFHYRHFTQRKADGSKRHLSEPDPTLKAVQQRINRAFLRSASVHHCAVGYRRKLSVADHVWPHAGAQLIITADIQDFFPNTRAARVRDWWARQYESQQAIQLATLLTTYHGSLPQGAPTSPALSNILNYELDQRLSRRTERSGGVYTRYVDDMVFSWRTRHRPPADFQQAVKATLHEFGYALHPSKGWQIYRADDEPEITGVILRQSGRVTVTDDMRQIIAELERTNPHGQRLAGYRGFQDMVERYQLRS